jgi:uncharacterized membrane protein
MSLRRTVRASATILAPAEALFECLADYKRAEVFIEGLEELTPSGPQTTGEGARFEAVLHVGPRVLRTTIIIASLVAGRAITWSSVGADRQSLVFELAQTDDETAVSLEISYEEPGGVAGALLAPFVRQTVERRANTALKRLGKQVSAS